ncbi:MAG: glycosyltransferase family protein, partial [Saprospiraceae bacterium]|nr:glycosyltransferase family protein [Saprospiraceae bacterium]
MSHKHILFAVLNWGLGHATRSIPVIRACLQEGHTVTLASDGFPLKFLRREFPALSAVELPGYDISYDPGAMTHRAWMLFLAVQSASRKEYQVVQQLHHEHAFDAVISDNRYGCYISGIPCALMTHQLRIAGSNFAGNQLGTRAIRKWTRPFDYLWVPDTPERKLSGKMSEDFDERMRFLGPLSDLVP